jgi:hypothetical protein
MAIKSSDFQTIDFQPNPFLSGWFLNELHIGGNLIPMFQGDKSQGSKRRVGHL